jgi:low temperature requirement protein LtrA
MSAPADLTRAQTPAKRLLGRMVGRDIHETNRVSTPLELLFDLTFVVAIAAAASQLHHAVGEHHLSLGILAYLTSFAAIWWAWMNFTWFASAYDTDDPTYRLWTMVQMVGVLILASGVSRIAQGDFTTVTIGYAVMRIGLLAMWLRAAREHPERRRTAIRFALGIGAVQLLWLARLALPATWSLPSFFVLMLLELAIPLWAEKAGRTPWHAHHIAERYGLFTIIVLGECVLGATNAVAGVIETQGWSLGVAMVGLGSVSLVLSLWWVYFLVPSAEALHHHRERAFNWGYGHFVVFGSLAALGAFLEVVADGLNGGSSAHAVAPTLAIGLVAAAIGIYLMTVWWLHRHIARGQAQLGWAWGSAAFILAAVVAAVAAGLPLAWAIPAVTAAPAVVIAAMEYGRVKRPELFHVR